MLLTAGRLRQQLEILTSDLRERLQRLEDDQTQLRARFDGERHLRILTASISSETQIAPIIGKAFEDFALAMSGTVPRGRASGLARGCEVPGAFSMVHSCRSLKRKKRIGRSMSVMRRAAVSVRHRPFDTQTVHSRSKMSFASRGLGTETGQPF
jgi:hypothetical protein